MIARILWWNDEKTQGVAQVVDEQGIVSKYFLLASKIVQRPQQIRAGMQVKFTEVLQAKRQDLLPIAINVTVEPYDAPLASNTSSNASGVAGLALKAGA
jgi:hypothetical protein